MEQTTKILNKILALAPRGFHGEDFSKEVVKFLKTQRGWKVSTFGGNTEDHDWEKEVPIKGCRPAHICLHIKLGYKTKSPCVGIILTGPKLPLPKYILDNPTGFKDRRFFVADGQDEIKSVEELKEALKKAEVQAKEYAKKVEQALEKASKRK